MILFPFMKKKTFEGSIMGDMVMGENTDHFREFCTRGVYGALTKQTVQLSFLEALYLVENERLIVMDGRKKPLSFDNLLRRIVRKDKTFWTKYCVYQDLRERGYVVKTALKFGADFRVYDRGIKPGDDHAKWIVYPVSESSTLTWYEFSAKNRVAHSTRKRLMMAVVDVEGDVSYWEARWMRP